jgi:hypothetical protein
MKHTGHEKQGQIDGRENRGGNDQDGNNGGQGVATSANGGEMKKVQKSLTYSQIRWIGESILQALTPLGGSNIFFCYNRIESHP